MSPSRVRLDDARERVRLLEDIIARTREEYPDADPHALAHYLSSTLEELRAVRESIDAELGVDSIDHARASAWVRIKGRRVGDGRAPVYTVGKLLASIQTAVRQLASYIETGSATPTRIAESIAAEVSLEVTAFAPGSLSIGIAPEIAQLRLDHPAPLSEVALAKFLEVWAWAEDQRSDEDLEGMIPNPTLRRQMLARIAEIAPSEEGAYETISITGPITSARPSAAFTMSGQGYTHALAYLRRKTKEHASYHGQLVAIDVEKGKFDLRTGTKRVACYFGSHLHQTAKHLVEEYVEVAGEGTFVPDDELPVRLDANQLRVLTPHEQARLS